MDQQDCTTVVRMQRNFEQFVTGSVQPRNQSSVSCKLSFDDSFCTEKNQSSQSGFTRHSVLDDEKETQRRVELLTARSKVTSLENKLLSENTARKRARIEHNQDIEGIKQKYQHDINKVADLKQQLLLMVEKDEESQASLAELQSVHDSKKILYEERILKLQEEKTKLKAQLDEVKQDVWEKEKNQTMERVNTDMDLTIYRSKVAELSEKLKHNQRLLEISENQIEEQCERLEFLEGTEQRVKELEQQLAQVEDDAVIGRTMRDQLVRMPQLERANKKLTEENALCREKQENVLLLKEEAQSLRRKLDRAETRACQVEQLQVDKQELEKQLKKWQITDPTSGDNIKGAEELPRIVGQLQSTNSLLLEKQGHLLTSIHSLEESLKATESKLTETDVKLKRSQTCQQQQADLIKKLQRKLLLVSKERDAFKDVLDRYENEATINMDSHMVNRVRQLESVIETHQRNAALQEHELQQARDQLADSVTKIQAKESEIVELKQGDRQRSLLSDVDHMLVAELREKIADLEKQLEKQLEEVDVLEGRLERHNLQGDYDPRTTKVVHLMSNPSSWVQEERKEVIQHLKQENAALAERVRLIQEAGEPVEDLTAKVEEQLQQPGSSEELDELKTQVKSAELKNQRLMEAFRKKSHEFREVIYQLLGYQVNSTSDNQYCLLNMYAESPEHKLLFRSDKHGVHLLENQYSASLSSLIDEYLSQANSIPGFLSALTLQLHSSQTMVAPPSD